MKSRAPATAGLSVEEVARLRMAVLRLARLIRQRATADITPSQLAVLVTVERHGPLTVGDIAAREQVRPPSASRIVAALCEQGLVARQGEAADRRVSRIAITSAGQALVDEHRNQGRTWLAGLVDGLEPDDVVRLRHALPVLEHLLEERR